LRGSIEEFGEGVAGLVVVMEVVEDVKEPVCPPMSLGKSTEEEEEEEVECSLHGVAMEALEGVQQDQKHVNSVVLDEKEEEG
jgi:hypothetical protein